MLHNWNHTENAVFWDWNDQNKKTKLITCTSALQREKEKKWGGQEGREGRKKERQVIDWEKIFENHISTKNLHLKYTKNPQNSIAKKISKPSK